MNIEKMREEFEVAYMNDVSERFHGAEVEDDEWVARGSDGEYQSFRAAGAWWAWQASAQESRSALANQLVSTLSISRGRPIEWREAIEITAIITAMDQQEKQRLLDMDD